MVGTRARVVLSIILGVILFLAGCELPMNPVEIEVADGSTYASPQDEGIIDVQAGTKFMFYSLFYGLNAVVLFRVPAAGSYNVHYGGRDVFDIAIRLDEMGPTVAVLEADVTDTVTLAAGTDYYLEIEQTGGAMMGATSVTIWAD